MAEDDIIDFNLTIILDVQISYHNYASRTYNYSASTACSLLNVASRSFS